MMSSEGVRNKPLHEIPSSNEDKHQIHRHFTTILYQHGEERRWRGQQEEQIPSLSAWCRQRSSSGDNIRVSFFWAIPGCACRGRFMHVFPLLWSISGWMKGGWVCVIQLCVYIGNKLSLYSCVYIFFCIYDFFSFFLHIQGHSLFSLLSGNKQKR